jgi:hypothetical protein
MFWIYDKTKKDPLPQTPVNTGIEGYLYDLENPKSSTGHDDSIETKFFSPMDGAAKNILDRLQLRGEKVEKKQKNFLSVYLSLMHLRVPKIIGLAREIGEALGEAMLESDGGKQTGIESIGTYFENGEKEEFLQKNKTKSMVLKKETAMIASLSQSKNLALELLAYNWCLCRSPRNAFFVTGDAPVVPFKMNPNGMALIGSGFRVASEITFPISPDICLLLQKRNGSNRRAVSELFVEEINRRTVYNSARFVISPFKSRKVSDFVDQFRFTINRSLIDKAGIKRNWENNINQ